MTDWFVGCTKIDHGLEWLVMGFIRCRLFIRLSMKRVDTLMWLTVIVLIVFLFGFVLVVNGLTSGST